MPNPHAEEPPRPPAAPPRHRPLLRAHEPRLPTELLRAGHGRLLAAPAPARSRSPGPPPAASSPGPPHHRPAAARRERRHFVSAPTSRFKSSRSPAGGPATGIGPAARPGASGRGWRRRRRRRGGGGGDGGRGGGGRAAAAQEGADNLNSDVKIFLVVLKAVSFWGNELQISRMTIELLFTIFRHKIFINIIKVSCLVPEFFSALISSISVSVWHCHFRDICDGIQKKYFSTVETSAQCLGLHMETSHIIQHLFYKLINDFNSALNELNWYLIIKRNISVLKVRHSII
ncbi:Protein of unknown function [Gryllus bimaculatus]|nr:Protein of unknown function [Gryllus bimaculatus]